MLTDDLKVLLGSTFVLYTKIHGFHFNVEGSQFLQYHEFLNIYYTEVYETIDKVGEYIRAQEAYAPGSLARMMELSVIHDQPKIPRATLMLEELLEDSAMMIGLVQRIFAIATEQNEQSIANYMAELQDLYAKKQWMLKSILKLDRA